MPLATALQAAFERRADGVPGAGGPLVGIFGSGVPEAVIAAHGGRPVDVKAPPLADAMDGPCVDAVDRVTEAFVDPFAVRFLHRLAAGAFDHFVLIVFARDDVAGLAAYQYASELRRQGRIPRTGPRLFLWNLLHTQGAAAAAFNLTAWQALTACLAETLGGAARDEALLIAVANRAVQRAAMARLPAGGTESFVARNAGRWLDPETHASLLARVAPPVAEGPRIVLVGTACDIPVMHDLCAGLGQVVADLQEYGRAHTQPDTGEPADLLRALADDDLNLRAAPPDRFTRALAAATEGAELVIASVDANDDGFGWELPGLRATVEARGARFVDLGFRPFRPDADWCANARARIEGALA